MHLNFSKVVAVVVTLSTLAVASTGFAVVIGAPGDGVSDYIYNPATGSLSIDPDGIDVGAFQIVSASGIFTGDAATLPAGLFASDTDTEIGVGSFNAATSAVVELGNVVQTGLTSAFLLTDLTTARGSGGFGTPNREFDLILDVPNQIAPTVGNDSLAVLLGDVVNFDFLALTDDPDGNKNNGNFSTTLGVNSGTPTIAPSIDANGNVTWDTAGTPLGSYEFEATFTDEQGLSDSGLLTVRVNVPEPASIAMFGLAMVGLGLLRRRK